MKARERDPNRPRSVSRPPAETAPDRDRTVAKLAHARNRRRQRDGHPGRTSWRNAPATPEQLEAMRLIASETGHTFTVGITRGEAWARICMATTLLDEGTRLRCSPPWHHTRIEAKVAA